MKTKITKIHKEMLEASNDFYEMFYDDKDGEFKNPHTFNIKEKLSIRHQLYLMSFKIYHITQNILKLKKKSND